MLRTAAVWICCLVLAACSSVNVKQDYDTSTNFSRLQTYAWLEEAGEAQKSTSNDPANSPLIDSRVRNAVNASLKAQGYQMVNKNIADFLVTYNYRIEEKYRDRDKVRTGIGIGTGSGGTFGSIGISIGTGNRDEKGRLTVDIVDPKTNNLIWRGSVEQSLVSGSDPKKTTKKINGAVSAILAKFPPKK